jgi:tRNA (guanosine-2'-O-)-methyltransferase
MQQKLVDHLSSYLTPERLNLFNKVLAKRTRYLTVILEDIYQSQNASAVLRTCDCFGIQDVHIIENRNTFRLNPEVSLGSSKWLSLHKYDSAENNSIKAIQKVKGKGYRIVATTPHTNDQDLPDFDLTKGKAALIFGSELPGISQEVLSLADEYLKIPMYGFTESFNISVSAAIILHHLTLQLRKYSQIDWELNPTEKEQIKLDWIRNTIKRSDLIEQRFWEENR